MFNKKTVPFCFQGGRDSLLGSSEFFLKGQSGNHRSTFLLFNQINYMNEIHSGQLKPYIFIPICALNNFNES